MWRVGDDDLDKGLLIINTGGTFSSGNADPSKGWGPANQVEGFKIEDEILRFLESRGLVWIPDPLLVTHSFNEAECETHVQDLLKHGLWNDRLNGTIRHLLKTLKVSPEAREMVVAGIREKGIAAQSRRYQRQSS